MNWKSFMVLLVLMSGSSFAFLTVPAQSHMPLFFDNFESYNATAICRSPADNCDPPPHFNPAMNAFPEYWIPASSGTCTKRTDLGGCVMWDGNHNMGPNSVWAVVTEQNASPNGNKSVKLGASDYAYDKTSMAFHLSPDLFPLNGPGLLTMGFKIWFGDGINADNNNLVIQMPGTKMRYLGRGAGTGSPGLWQYQSSPQATLAFADLGHYQLTTGTWHTISETLDLESDTYQSLTIDGQGPFSNLSGLRAYVHLATSDVKTYYDFAIFIVPNSDRQSITVAGLDGLYAYVDDVEVDTTAATTSPYSTLTSSTTPSTSSSSISSAATTSPYSTLTSSPTTQVLNTQQLPGIPGFSWGSILLGIITGLAVLVLVRRRRAGHGKQ